MKKVKEIIEVMETLAPTFLKEDFDNVGLMVGDREKEVKKVLLALDCTLKVVEEAKENNVDFDFKDISSSFPALKEYLNIRETNPIYEEVKNKGGLGIPCFLKDEKVTLNLDDVL